MILKTKIMFIQIKNRAPCHQRQVSMSAMPTVQLIVPAIVLMPAKMPAVFLMLEPRY